MNVLERTREIGILRCIGARGRDIRRIFATEGLVLAAGRLGRGRSARHGLDRLFVWLIRDASSASTSRSRSRPGDVVPALAGTIPLGPRS